MGMVENALPVLPVRDLALSIRFYADVLGFSVEWGCGEAGSGNGLEISGTGFSENRRLFTEWTVEKLTFAQALGVPLRRMIWVSQKLPVESP